MSWSEKYEPEKLEDFRGISKNKTHPMRTPPLAAVLIMFGFSPFFQSNSSEVRQMEYSWNREN